MFKFQRLTLPSGLMFRYHASAIVPAEETTPTPPQQRPRERSLSPDSLEQRLLKQHFVSDDGADNDDDDESFLSSSSSLVDSISIDQQRQSNSKKTMLKTLSAHGVLNTLSFSNDDDDDINDDDLDEIRIDQDDVNLLFSDPDDGILSRLSHELIDVDDDDEDYDDDNEDFFRHILPLPLETASDLVHSSPSSLDDQQLSPQYSPYQLLDPISEAASEDERRAAVSISRQQQKHKHSTSSSLSISANGYCDGDTTTNDDLSTLSDIDQQNTSMDENSVSQTSSIVHDQQQNHVHKKRRHTDIPSTHWSTRNGTIEPSGASEDTLERLRNITKMFSAKTNEDDEPQLKKVERVAPGDKIKNTFQKFEEAGSSNGVQNEDEDDTDDTQETESDGVIRSSRKKKAPKEHVPYHEMAEVKDKFEKGLVDSDKPRAEKRLDVRVQSGLASSKKQAFEQGEFEQEVEPHVGKVQIDADLVAGLASSKKQAFEQHQLDNEANLPKTVVIDRDALAGAATEAKARFEKGEFDHDYHEFGSNRVQADADLLVGATTDKKAKFESGQVSDRATTPTRRDEISSMVETGNAQAKRSELLSKIDAEQQVQRSGDRHIDISTEQGLATARREQLTSLANSEFKATDKHIDVASGLASTIKEQYMADTSKATASKAGPDVSVESGLAKSRATAFENPDEATIKRTVEIDNDLLERGVAKERMAMFKNLQSGAQPSTGAGGDSKIRVDRVEFSDTLVNMSVRLKLKPTDSDKNIVSTSSGEENGNVVRESDKREEFYFEKGQTKQLVEQWKTKQVSPDRDTPDAQVIRDAEILQQGKAKNLVEKWKTMDKENTPPPERRGPRAMTPPPDNERRLTVTEDDEDGSSRKPGYADDKANIESGHAKAVRESDDEQDGVESLISIVRHCWSTKTDNDELMQTAEQNNATNVRKTLKQVTPPPEGSRRKSPSPTETSSSSSGITEQYNNNEEVVPTKGQAQSLKNRFTEFEKDALKVETASGKIKHTPKRFVDTPVPKQVNVEPAVDPNKCSVCNKTVYAMEKIEADKKVYHKACFKCMHCKSILKLGNYTANDGQIYCKPHFLQLFAIKGNYSAGFGLNDHKARWLPNSSSPPPSSTLNSHESASFNEN